MITQLDPRLASRIAAGEVIERPQSIARELLDNAIDAGADEIRVEIDGGGIERLSVIDNGKGISRADLEKIGLRHATSKIREEDDLYKISTLGFRGEAIYSISAVSRFTIKTKSAETGEGSLLVIDNGERHPAEPYGIDKGTIASSENLFADIPARRYFLKRPSTEANLIRNLVISKALAFPSIRFTFVSDGAIRLDWPAAASLKERCMMLYRSLGIADADVDSIERKGEDFSVAIISGNSSLKRSDRKEIRIYVNGRPVDDYALSQAVIYGYGELLPGGAYPYAAVFIEDSPEMVDFNIHPTKKEVKLRNAAEIHHAISDGLKKSVERRIPEASVQREFYLEDSVRTYEPNQARTPSKAPSWTPPKAQPFSHASSSPSIPARMTAYREKDNSWLDKAKSMKHEEMPVPDRSISFRYIGQAFQLFLIVEMEGELLFIDQHAAHERILYDELIAKHDVQKLLVPISLEADRALSDFLDQHAEVYSKLGIILMKNEDDWEITALPASCRPIESEIVDFIKSARLDGEELESKLFAVIACRAAIKAGDPIDRWSAEELIRKVFQLSEPACPHGRTFITKLSEEELRTLAGRTS